MTDKDKENQTPLSPPPPKPQEKQEPLIPTCSTCGRPFTRCACKHNELIK